MKDFNYYIALREKYNLKTATREEEAEFIALTESGGYAGDEEALGRDEWEKFANVARTEADHQRDVQMYSEFMTGRKTAKVRAITRVTTWLAAASVVIAAAAIGFWNYKTNHVQSELVADAAIIVNGPSYVRLPDRSIVELSEGSQLSYNKASYPTNREVMLTGTAFFDIKHDPARRFKVRSGRVLTTVLGTSFVVSESDDLKYIGVTVITGKVTVSDMSDTNKEFLTVLPHQKVTVKTDDGKNELLFSMNRQVNVHEELKFKENNILFDGVSVRDAMVVLEKRFGIDIEIENERIETCPLTLSFVHNESLKDVLDYICPLFDATPVIEGNHVTIRGGIPCDNLN
jgi:transmembrane sensor